MLNKVGLSPNLMAKRIQQVSFSDRMIKSDEENIAEQFKINVNSTLPPKHKNLTSRILLNLMSALPKRGEIDAHQLRMALDSEARAFNSSV